MTGKISNMTTIERELHINAPPEVIFGLLTDPDRIVQWMGRAAVADAKPGGVIEIDINGFDVMRGEYLEVTPYTRVVFSMGWLSLAADAVRPGTSRVEFTLNDEAGGTRLQFVHSGLPELAVAEHAEGWDFFTGRLARVAQGGDVERGPELTTAEEMASRLNALLIETVEILDGAPDRSVEATVPGDGRTAAAVADHIAGHLTLADFASAIATGGDAPPFTAEEVDRGNAARAAEMAKTPRSALIEAVRAQGPIAVATIRNLTDEQLRVAKPLPATGGAAVSAGELIESALIGDIERHLKGLRDAIAAA